MYVIMWIQCTVVQKLFDGKYFIVQGKNILVDTWLPRNIFTLNSNNSCLFMPPQQSQHWTAVKTINAYSYYPMTTLCRKYIILLTLPFMQYEVQSGYSECETSFIDQRLLSSGRRWPGYVRRTSLHYNTYRSYCS